MKEHKDYESYDFDRLTEGSKIQIEHTIYVNETDMSDLISKPISEIQAMREESVAKEKTAFEKVRQAAQDWEKQAAVTRRFDRAIEYLNVPEVSHTSNKWEKDRYDKFTRSNRVYKMTYDIYERSSWRTDATKYDVRWNIYTNSPHKNYNEKVAGQERSFADKASAEKYLQGRIKAYAHLFTENSPPIPDEYTRPFIVHGQLLPGYTTEAMQKAQEQLLPDKKPSIRKQLTEQAKEIKPEQKSVKRTGPELG